MRAIKSFIISIALTLTLITSVSAEFFSDIIVTSPDGIWTDSRAYNSLTDAVNAIGSTKQRTIVISSQLSVGNITIPSNITLKFERDGAIINSGQLTLNTRNIIAENRQIFAGAGDIDFTSGTVLKSGWFSTFERAALVTADDSVTLIITKPQTLTTTVALGNNVVLKWDGSGNILTANTGVDIQNICNIEAGDFQLFAGAGDFDFTNGMDLKLSWFARLRSAITYIGSDEVTLNVTRPSTVDLTDTIPSNVSLNIAKGSPLTISPGQVLTISGPLLSTGAYQQFVAVSGEVVGLPDAKIEWFGPAAVAAEAAAELAAEQMDLTIQALGTNAAALPCYLYPTGTGYNVYRHLGGADWLEIALTNSGALATGVNSPWKVTAQTVKNLTGYLLVADMTKGGSGTWTNYNTLNATPYIGHTVTQNPTVGGTLTVTATFSGDLTLAYLGKTSGGMVDVVVDALDPVTVDTYNAIDLTVSTAAIATDLALASHTITLTIRADKNAASTGYTCVFNAFKILNSPDLVPSSVMVYPKSWAPSTVYAAYAEVQGPTGRFYCSSAGGTSGATPPTHTTGAVSDGGVSWTALARSSYTFGSTLIQGSGSEMEYAYDFTPTGSTVETIGGNVHGHEYLTKPLEVYLNGTYTSVAANTWYSGYIIEIKQSIQDYHGATYAAMSSLVANVAQTHRFDLKCMTVSYDMEFQAAGAIGNYYPAMWPLVVYYAANPTKVMVNMYNAAGTSISLKNYEGKSDPTAYSAIDYMMAAEGRCYVTPGVTGSGTPTADNGTTGITIALRCSPQSLNYFLHSKFNASNHANISGGSYTGQTSWIAKMYFARSNTSAPELAYIGKKISATNEYYVKIHTNALDVSGL